MDIRNLGNFPNLAAVWQAYPSGGLEGDYLYVPNTSGVKYSWNKFARTWGNEDDPGTPSRQGNSISDLNVQNELNVGSAADFHSDVHIRGKLYAEHVKQPNVGMFATLAALQAAYPHPEVGMWATVGDSMPGAVYRCDTAGTWTATGGTGGVDEIDNVLMYSAQELTSSQKKQAQQNIGVTLCNVAEVNDFVVDIVLKEGADNPESENYVDISNATAIVIQCSYINQNTNKYTNSLQIYTGNEWVNLFYKSYDTLEEAKDDFGKLLENQKCLVVIRGDGSYRTTIYSPLVFGRDISWKSLNEHPVIKELLIEQQTSEEITESHNELSGRIAVMDKKIGFFNWEKDKLFRTTTSDDTQLAVIGEPYTLTDMSWPNSKYAIIDVVPGDQIYINSKGINNRTATYLILGTNDVVIDYNKDGDNNISGGAVDAIITMPSGAKKLLVNAFNGAYGASYPESVEGQLEEITESYNELSGRIVAMDKKIGFFNWKKDEVFRTTTPDDTQLAVIGEPYTLTEMSWPNSKYAIIDVVPGDQIYINSKGINNRTATYLILGTNDVVIDYNKDGDNNISGGAVDAIITMPSGAKKLLVNAANGAYGASYPESVEDQLKKITFSDGVYKIPKVFDSTANSFLSSNALQDISVVAVHNQNDFDNINATVLELLNHGSKGVKVEIDAGTYLAKDIIDFSNINTECSISFAGKGVNIICSDTILLSSNKVGFTNTHDIYTHVFDTGDIYIGDDFSEIKLSNLESKFGFWPKAASQVEKSSVFGGETECRLLLPDDCQFLTYTQGMTIALTSWYLCVNGNVLGIHDGYIHFNVPDAAYIDFDNKVNGDFSRYSSYPRFNVSNIGCDDSYAFAYDGKLYIPNRYKKIYCCNKSGFVRVSNNPNMSVCISGLNFVGSKLNQSNHADNSVITIADVKSSYIINNTFAYNGNTCIANKSTLGTTGTKHIVSHNIATNLKNRFSYIRCDDVTFEYNEIRDTGQIYLCGATKFHGARFYIGHNSVLNSPYHCLSVGISKESENEISGVVEYNHCYNEREYIAKNKTLSDFGIVSFYLYNTDIICRNNVIHGAYSCCGEARGIFGDDGCNNVKITGNLVWGCKTFCIDFRYVSTEMSTSGSGNEMGNNVCVGKLRFQGSPTDSPAYIKPKLGSNYYTDAIFSSNVEREGEDFLIQAKVHEHFVECLNNLPDLTPFIASYIQ